MKVYVLSAPGREELNAFTFARFKEQNPGVAFTIHLSSGRDPIGDFWGMLRAAAGEDLLALEDDIVTARNFFRYAEGWSSPHLTSFFHVRRPVLRVPVSPHDFSFCQAIKIPRALLERLLELPPRPLMPGSAQDDDLARALNLLGERVIYHRSLVQHIGLRSSIWPASIDLGGRQSLDFAGLDFDCLA